MIDSAHLKRLRLGTAVLLALSAGATLAAGLPPSFAGGLAVGWLLGAAPFASWTWIVSRALGTSRGRALTVVLLVTKMGLYAGTLYLSVTRKLVSPVGVLIGITGVSLILVLGSLLSRAPDAKEAA